jgi:hypothetical protein
VSGLTALDAHFAEGHVPLGIVLGTIGALSLVTNALPDETRNVLRDETETVEVRSSGIDESRPVDPFLALLLGAVAMHDRLIALVDRAGDSVPERAREADVVDADPLEGIAR